MQRIPLSFLIFYLFFFSSRRRHTRSLCDWSSDVCSSDLAYFSVSATRRFFQLNCANTLARMLCGCSGGNTYGKLKRSEERRVGKECRCRWSRDQDKRKSH